MHFRVGMLLAFFIGKCSTCIFFMQATPLYCWNIAEVCGSKKLAGNGVTLVFTSFHHSK